MQFGKSWVLIPSESYGIFFGPDFLRKGQPETESGNVYRHFDKVG